MLMLLLFFENKTGNRTRLHVPVIIHVQLHVNRMVSHDVTVLSLRKDDIL